MADSDPPLPTVKHHRSFREVADEVVRQNRLKHEKDSEAHVLLRQKHGEHHQRIAESLPGISPPGSTGVIYVTDRATSHGFKGNEDPDWANFGQGARKPLLYSFSTCLNCLFPAEVGHLPGGSERPKYIDLEAMGEDIMEYGPTSGVKELREAVANLYNAEYRQGQKSQYTYENVCIVPGGRAGLTRVAAVIGDVLAAYQVPEYTAYDAMLSVFRRLVPIPAILEEKESYKLDLNALKKAIHGQGVSVVVMSNPRNPTGQAVEGEQLKELVGMARDGTTLVLDEFYSWYNHLGKLGESLSAASHVEDVNVDPIVLIDGLTKNWRLPGWRCCWVVGPKNLILALGQSGSFLDGGANHVLQVAAIPLLEPSRVKQDKLALQKHFRMKREVVLKRLEKMGLKVKIEPSWTFYIWLDLSSLPGPLNNGLTFFEECLKERVILTPGIFFDINPSKRRNLVDSPCSSFVRLSFGPPLPTLERGLDGIERVLHKAKHHGAHTMGKDLPAHPEPGTEHGGEAV